jgi:hypothetical protein
MMFLSTRITSVCSSPKSIQRCPIVAAISVEYRAAQQRSTGIKGFPQEEPADSAQVAAPQDAETRSNPEISEPMLDVHAPHQSVHTLKDFLLHIAAINMTAEVVPGAI